MVGGFVLDLEELARNLYKTGKQRKEILNELTILSGSNAKAEAIINEINNTENISDSFVKNLANFDESSVSAEVGGLGCRGSGDFYIHHKIAELIENKESIIDSKQQDDGGAVQVDKNIITVAVDGMHSRLSHFPLLAGFHVARAAIRDIIVMGGSPKALFSDIHLANDGDVAKVFDYTAGIAVVSELTNIPLIAGSTLRIGGDLVLGDRLTGCVGCVGFGKELTPRKNVQPGDILIMTEGSGGGTIATTALYNGCSKVVRETLNLQIINFGKELLKSELISNIHTLTDVTNGGIRGDAFEIANTANVRITIIENEFLKLINPLVIDMLQSLEIDPMGVSIDSILIIISEQFKDRVIEFIKHHGLKVGIIGRVDACDQKGPGVQLIKGEDDLVINNKSKIETENIIELIPKFREEPYTPIKKVVNTKVEQLDSIKKDIENAVKISINKKNMLKNWLVDNRQV